MRAVLQRVTTARVLVSGAETGRIGVGLLALVAVEDADGPDDIEWLARKMVELRVFEPAPVAAPAGAGADGPRDGAPRSRERSVVEVGGGILLVSQFTLFASTRKGTRPSWHRAARPDVAIPLYEAFHRRLAEVLGQPVPAGTFGAEMQVELTNDGPVTLWLDSKARE